MKKRIMALFLVLSMILPASGALITLAETNSVNTPLVVCGRDENGNVNPHTYVDGVCKFCSVPYFDGVAAESYASGTGTKNDPFVIETAAQLMLLANSTSNNDGIYYVLNNDIYLNDIAIFERNEDGYIIDIKEGQQPISWAGLGNYLSFLGDFDGKGHTVYGIYGGSGLFKSAYAATVRNVTVSDSLIVSGVWYVGAIANSATHANIDNCVNNKSTVIGRCIVGGIAGESYNDRRSMSITNCVNNGMVIATSYLWPDIPEASVGGIVGQVTSYSTCNLTISKCVNNGPVIGSQGYAVGGIIGDAIIRDNSSVLKVEDCFNTGEITSNHSWAAGIIGKVKIDENTSVFNVSRCYNAGNITAPDGACGIIGWLTSSNGVKLTQCYNVGYLASTNGVNNTTSMTQAMVGAFEGGLSYTSVSCYYHENSNVTVDSRAQKFTEAQMKNPSSFYGYNFTTDWGMSGCANYPYPVLSFARLGHNVDTYSPNVFLGRPAICEKTGYSYATCKTCGEEITKTIPAKIHSWEVTAAVTPTCTEPGYTEVTCRTCKSVQKNPGGNPFGHSLGAATLVAPTCTKEGYTSQTCYICQQDVKSNFVEPLLHAVDAKGFCTREDCIYAEYILGDVNNDGTVDDMDAMALERYLAHWVGYEVHPYASDVNSDEIVDDLDEMILTRYLANWILEYSIGEFTNNGYLLEE